MKVFCIIQSLFCVALIVHNIHLEADLNNVKPPTVMFHSEARPLKPAQIELLPNVSKVPDIQELRDEVEQSILDDESEGPQAELFPQAPEPEVAQVVKKRKAKKN